MRETHTHTFTVLPETAVAKILLLDRTRFPACKEAGPATVVSLAICRNEHIFRNYYIYIVAHTAMTLSPTQQTGI